ncbi:MAG: alanine:cation symporter family protein, partial [Gemmatimonadetes bacterium]|nr:alanine:cation symporter family protein [Gemmatimonadota bacterium]
KVDPATGHGLTGAPLTATAFSTGLPGNWGGYIVALGLAFFAFSTILGWSYYGERAVEYLFGVRAITPSRMVFVVAAFVGSFALEFGEAQRAGFAAVWGFSDVMNGAMAIPNLVGLLMLSRIVVGETQRYRAARQSPEGG